MNKELMALKASIEHWKKMIQWVHTQPSYDRPNMLTMDKAIDQDWSGESCALCQYFRTRNLYTNNASCFGCPLIPHCDSMEIGYDTKSVKHISLWSKVTSSISWEEWLTNAYNMLAELERLAKEREANKCTSSKPQSTSQL